MVGSGFVGSTCWSKLSDNVNYALTSILQIDCLFLSVCDVYATEVAQQKW